MRPFPSPAHAGRPHKSRAGHSAAWTSEVVPTFGPTLRAWRLARRMSQEDLAFGADTSTRHLSCLETQKARPSREMVLRLGRALNLPFRECNQLLQAAGFSASFAESRLDSTTLAPVQRAIDQMLHQQEPWPVIVLDRCWNVVQTNQGALRVLGTFLNPNIPAEVAGNLVRMVLHPDGARDVLVDWPEIAAAALARLERECVMHPMDTDRNRLRNEVLSWPGIADLPRGEFARQTAVQVVHLRKGPVEARFVTLLTTVGTPLDITAQELTLETWFPADEATESWVLAMAAQSQS